MSRMSSRQIEEFATRGYVLVRGMFSLEEAASFRDEAQRVWSHPGVLDHDGWKVQFRPAIGGGRVVERLEWVGEHSPLFAELMRGERISSAVAQLVGEPVTAFKDKLLVRPPGARGYALHQDFCNWDGMNIPPNRLVSACVAIDRIDTKSGVLAVLPGYHGERLPAPDGDPVATDPAFVDASLEEPLTFEPGDVLLLHVLTPHRSEPNHSSADRCALYFTYAPVSLGDDLYQRYRDLKADAPSP